MKRKRRHIKNSPLSKIYTSLNRFIKCQKLVRIYIESLEIKKKKKKNVHLKISNTFSNLYSILYIRNTLKRKAHIWRNTKYPEFQSEQKGHDFLSHVRTY